MELRFNGTKVEDLSKKNLIKMLKDIYVYAKTLETELRETKQKNADIKIITK